MPTSPKPAQIEEWCEAEVTRHFRALVESRLEDLFRQRGEVFFPFEPMKTQEAKAMLLGSESALQDILDALTEKDFQSLERVSDEERVRHSSEFGSRSDPAG
jgi:threonine synthase